MERETLVHLYWVNVPDDPSEDWFVLAYEASQNSPTWKRSDSKS